MGTNTLRLTHAADALITVLPAKLPKTLQTWGLAALVGIAFAGLLTFLPAITVTGPIEITIPWVADLGLSLSIYLDGLSLLFGLIITGVGTAIILYAGSYFDTSAEQTRFYALLIAFMGAMLALVMAGNILSLFIAWELTSILSFMLISFHGEKDEARSGALQALIITGGGGLALLVGLLIMGTAAGTMQISELLSNESLREHPWYAAFTVLILLGCFSKSAQFPFHFWLPGAMSAPTPASAYLHSATMVKAGIFLMARFYPVLSDTPLWSSLLLVVGIATMGMGALLALRQKDLKACLAYSTISQLGALTALLALPPEAGGVKAVMIGIVAHSLYKSTLFMMAGAVDHQTGTRLLDKLGGLRKQMPGWAVVTGIAALSMAGVPPLLGFVAKETLLEAMLSAPIALIVVVASAVMTITMALILVWGVFFGAPREGTRYKVQGAREEGARDEGLGKSEGARAVHEPPLHESGVRQHAAHEVAQQTAHGARQHAAHEVAHHHGMPRAMIVGPAALAGMSLLAGLGLGTFVEPLLEPMIHDPHLALFHGFNLPFLLSLLAFPIGIMLFVVRPVWSHPLAGNTHTSGTAIYRQVVGMVEATGDLLLKTQGGKLRYYLAVILGSMTLLMATAGLNHLQGSTWSLDFSGSTDIFKIVLLMLALGGMTASILSKRHLVAALCLGVAGYSIGGVFLLEPAPDVALVQFLVETLGTVLLIIMLGKISLPQRKEAMEKLWSGSQIGLIRDIAIAGAVGIGVTLFALAAVLNRPEANTVSLWHMENAFPILHFPDIVGAIVTDFRGMDTVIEITVFGMAAVGVYSLLTSHIKHKDFAALGSRLSTPLTRTVAKLVLPFSLLLAMAQLLYGGDGPGDGFTAGVTSGIGVALWYVVFGYHEARDRLKWMRPRLLIGGGILLVVLNGVLPMLMGYPFLSHLSFDIPLPAGLHLSTTFIYETGIFLTVFGSTAMIMEAIAHPKELEPQ